MKIPNIVPELKKIMDSLHKRDNLSFDESMEKMAIKFDKAGGVDVADKIRFEAERYKQRNRYPTLHSLPINKGTEMATVYIPIECGQRSKRLILNSMNRNIVDELIKIFEMKEEFIDQEVPMPNKLIMLGPPGTGKNITAFHIANQLDIPLLVVRLDSIIDSHMGDTGSNIRKIFDYAKKTPCVLFLDEFDAIARTRGESQDVKEMSRVVNTLLQCLDEFETDSLILAATNLNADLDGAVWRRFDTKMTFHLPNDIERRSQLELLLGDSSRKDYLTEEMTLLTVGSSYADIEQIVFKGKRKAIIERTPLNMNHLLIAQKEYSV